MIIPNTKPTTRQLSPIQGFALLLLVIDNITTMSQALEFPSELSSNVGNREREQATEMTHSMVNGTTAAISSGQLGSQNPTGANSLPSVLAESSLLVPTNFFSNVQAQKFRVNVSNICEGTQMRATIRMSRPFYGLIHTKDKRRRPACSLEGNGEQSYLMEISYTLNPTDPSHCGVVSHQLQQQPARANQQQQLNQSAPFSSQQLAPAPALIQRPQLTLSVVLVVRLHKSIEFSDDRYFLLSCANRCARPDCSASGNSRLEDSSARLVAGIQTPPQPPAAARSGQFVASESVISSMVRTNALNESNRSTLEHLRQANPAWPTEKCDTMLDLKFQWLVKLCWLLSTLLAVLLCATLYMCGMNLGTSKLADRKGNSKAAKSTKMSSQNKASNGGDNIKSKSMGYNSKQVIYSPPSQSENISWTGTANTNIANSNDGSDQHHQHHDHLVNQMRDNNPYLAKQQRQLMLANLHLMALNQAQNEQRQHQLQADHSNLVLGRSAEVNMGQPLAARVKRRRSIGSSMAPGCHDRQDGEYHHLGTNQAKLLTNERAKSRSQTTIFYEQSLDPFKTAPFNYTCNNGFQSEGENSNRVYLGSDFIGTEVYGMPMATSRTPLDSSRFQTFVAPSDHNSAESGSHSMPPDVHMHQANHQSLPSNTSNTINRQELFRKHGLRTNLKPSFVPPPQIETIQVQGTRKLITQPHQQQQQPNSQFDPQNSRQLIDLLQQKHRQQMEHANITAANIQSSQGKVDNQQHQMQEYITSSYSTDITGSR